MTRIVVDPASMSDGVRGFRECAGEIERIGSDLARLGLPDMPPDLRVAVTDVLRGAMRPTREQADLLQREATALQARVRWAQVAAHGELSDWRQGFFGFPQGPKHRGFLGTVGHLGSGLLKVDARILGALAPTPTHLKELAEGPEHLVVGLGKAVVAIDEFGIGFLIDPAGGLKTLGHVVSQVPKAAPYIWRHKLEFAEDLIDWKDLRHGHIYKWVGNVGTSIALVFVTGGTGELAEAANAGRVAAGAAVDANAAAAADAAAAAGRDALADAVDGASETEVASAETTRRLTNAAMRTEAAYQGAMQDLAPLRVLLARTRLAIERDAANLADGQLQQASAAREALETDLHRQTEVLREATARMITAQERADAARAARGVARAHLAKHVAEHYVAEAPVEKGIDAESEEPWPDIAGSVPLPSATHE